MASISSVIAGHRGIGDQGPRIQRVEPQRQRLALGLLLTGQLNPDDPAVDQFLQFARDQALSLDELWAAIDGRSLKAAALLAPSRGRTAMAFISPLRRRRQTELHSRLLRTACDAQEPARLRLVQSLLDPHQSAERRALTDAGFEALATLVYMQCRAERLLRDDETAGRLGDSTIEILPWRDEHRPIFAQVIAASYEQTLDCPRLLRARTIDDVIEGHMATGRFDPRLWYAFIRGDEPIGVMLLNPIPPRAAVELVYLGLTVPWRGRGLGRRMLEMGIDAAARHGAQTLLLAVDELNAPALRIYRSMSMRPTARKTAMIRMIH